MSSTHTEAVYRRDLAHWVWRIPGLLGSPVLRVRGKGRRERTVPLAPEVLESIDAYLDDRSARLAPCRRRDALLVTAKGKPLGRAALNWHIERWCSRAGVMRPTGEVAHAFRHTYAKGLVARGVALPVVQQLLGDKDLKTTSVYLRMTAVEVAEGAAAAAVRDHLRAVPAPPTGQESPPGNDSHDHA